MRKYLGVGLACAVVAAVAALTAAAQQPTAPLGPAFEHYEKIRTALAQDTTNGVAADAQALAALAAEIAGDEARRAAHALAQAKDIEGAREEFGKLSEALVPRFLEAGLPGVEGFVCPMKQKRWVQRGSTIANPYYGKAMATCGTPIKTGQKK